MCGNCTAEANREERYRTEALTIEKQKLRELQRQGGGAPISEGSSAPPTGIVLQVIGFLFGFLGMCEVWITFCNHYKIPTGDGSHLQTAACFIFFILAAIFRKTFGKAAVFLFAIAIIVFIVAVALKVQKGS